MSTLSDSEHPIVGYIVEKKDANPALKSKLLVTYGSPYHC